MALCGMVADVTTELLSPKSQDVPESLKGTFLSVLMMAREPPKESPESPGNG